MENVAEPIMLTLKLAMPVAGVLTSLAVLAAGCSYSGSDIAEPRAEPTLIADEVCRSISLQKDVGEDLKVYKAVSTTAADVERWLQSRADAGAPRVTLAKYTDLRVDSAASSMLVCLFQGPPRPIPQPKGREEIVADGISVLVDAAGGYQIDGIGPIGKLDAQVSALNE